MQDEEKRFVTRTLRKFDRDRAYLPQRGVPFYYLSRKTSTDNKVERFCAVSLQWCENTFGTRKAKPAPDIEWMWNDRWYQRHNFLAFYDWEDNIISIRIQGHRTYPNLAKTIIHEYIHYLQPNRKGEYEEWDNKVGYYNNPYEWEATYLSELYYMECTAWVRTKLRYYKQG